MTIKSLAIVSAVVSLSALSTNVYAQRAVDHLDGGSTTAQSIKISDEQLDALFPEGAASKTLTMPLGNDGTQLSREFVINHDDRAQTLKEVVEWREKAEVLAPIFESEDSVFARTPGASCNGANAGSVASETTNYSNPNTGMCWTESTTYVCSETASGSAGFTIFGFTFGASAPIYGWVQSQSSSTQAQLCP